MNRGKIKEWKKKHPVLFISTIFFYNIIFIVALHIKTFLKANIDDVRQNFLMKFSICCLINRSSFHEILNWTEQKSFFSSVILNSSAMIWCHRWVRCTVSTVNVGFCFQKKKWEGFHSMSQSRKKTNVQLNLPNGCTLQ